MKRTLALIGLAVLLVAVVKAWGVTSRQTRLYGTAIFFNETLDQAKVTLTLSGANYFWTSTQAIVPGQQITYTDTAGYFAFAAVWGVDSLFPAGNATYSLIIEQPKLQKGGIVFQASGLTINADGDSTDIRNVLAQ